MIEEIRELFQNFIAPQLESIKGDIRALDAKFDARVDALDTKFDAKFDLLDAKIGAVDTKVGTPEVEEFRMNLWETKTPLLGKAWQRRGGHAIK